MVNFIPPIQLILTIEKMRALLIFIAFCGLSMGCKPSRIEADDNTSKVEGIYKINAILTGGKKLSQTNAILQISLVHNAVNRAKFAVTYVSESGKTVVDEVETSFDMTTEGYVLFYDINHYPTSRFAIWNQNTINCNPLVGQGPSVGFYAEK